MPLGQTQTQILVLTVCRQKQKSICPALKMAEEEGPCEWEGELDDGFPTGQVSIHADPRRTRAHRTRVSPRE